MSSNNQPLSDNPLVPLQRVSLNSATTNVILDSDTGNSSLVVKTGTTNSLYIDKYSNVGINTGNPTAQLEIASTNGSCVRMRYGTSSTAYSDIFTTADGNLSIHSNSGLVNITSEVSLSGDLTIGGTLTVSGGGSISSVLGVVDPTAIGTAAAGKTLIVDSSLNITGINTIGVASIQMGSSTISTTDAGYLSELTQGTATASKALVINALKNISGINSLSATLLTGQLQSNEQTLITKLGTLSELTVGGITKITSTLDAVNVSDGGAFTVSGGMSIAKNAYIGGNLYVQGSTTTVSSTNISIKDNTLILNATPVGPYDSGILVERYQTNNDINIGSIATDTPTLITTVASANSLNVVMAAGNSTNDYYQGWWIRINNQIRKVASYTGATKTITVDAAFAITPINGDTINLFNKTYAGIVWNETNKQFQTLYTAYDNTVLVNQNNAPLKTGLLTSDSISTNGLTSSGMISVTDATEATTLSSASVVLSGGLSIAKALRVGNGIYGTLQTGPQPNITSIGSLTSAISTAFINNTTNNINYQTWTNSASANVVTCIQMTNLGSSIGTSSNHPLRLLSNNTARLWTTADGYSSIGRTATAQTTYDLSVQGSLNATSVYVNGVSTIDSSYNATFNAVTLTSTLTIGSASINATKLGYLDTTPTGTVVANKVLIADANKMISGLASISISNTAPSAVVYKSLISDTYTFTEGVQGSATVISANSYYWNYNNAYRLFMNPSGKIAIGFTTTTGTMFDYGLNVNGTFNATNYYINGTVVNLGRIQTPTAGTASANCALVVDGANDIAGINSLSTASITIGSNVITSTESGYLTNITKGTAIASKAIITDTNNSITGINTLNATQLYVNNVPVLTSGSTALAYITNATVGTAVATTAMVVDANREIINMHAIGFSDTTTTGQTNITFTSDAYSMSMGLRGSVNTNGANLAYLAFNGSDRLIMNTSGNIAIGTTAISTYKVNVNGTVNSTGYYLNGAELSLTSVSIINDITNGIALADKALVLDSSKNITGINSLTSTSITIGTNVISSTIAGYLTLTTIGVAEASKALILNASSNITGINSLSTSSITINSNIISTEASFIAGAQSGTATAGKVLVVDSSKNITGIGSLSLTSLIINGTTITDTMIGYITGITAGTASAGKALIVSSPDKNIIGLGQVSCGSLVLGGNVLTADQFQYVNNLVAGTITPNRALVIGPNYEATFGTSSIVFENNMFNIKLSNDSPTDYAVVQRWTNFLTGDDLITDISFSNYACRFGTYSNHAMRIITNNSTKIYIDTIGNVGIGNNSPAYMLDITGTARVVQLLVGTSADAASNRFITALDNTMSVSTSKSLTLGYSNTNNNQAELSFYLNAVDSSNNRFDIGTKGSTSLMSIRFDGNVGIGTTTPAYKLDIGGTINASDALSIGTSTVISSSLYATFNKCITGGTTLSYTSASTTSTESIMRLAQTNINNTSTSGTDANIRSAFYINKPTLTATNVGIITTNAATCYITGAPIAGTNNAITNAWALYADGPCYVNGNVKLMGSIINGSTTVINSSGVLQVAAQTNITSVGTLTGLAISSTVMHATSITNTSSAGLADIMFNAQGSTSTEIGIRGSTTPEYPNCFYIWRGGFKLIMDAAGNIAIGDKSPAYKLDVVGDINGSGSIYVAGTKIIDTTGAIVASSYYTSTGAFYAATNTSVVSSSKCSEYVFQIRNGDAASTNLQGIGFECGTTSAANTSPTSSITVFRTTGYTGGLIFSTKSTNTATADCVERVRISATGYLGIANNNPAYPLDVIGDISLSGSIRNGTTALMNSSGVLQVAGQTNITSVGTLTGLTSSGNVNITSTTEATNYNAASIVTAGGIGSAKAIWSNTNVLMAGSLGIGTTTPNFKIHMKGTASNQLLSLYANGNTSADDFYGFGANGSAVLYHAVSGHDFYLGTKGDGTGGTKYLSLSSTSLSVIPTTDASSTTTGALVVAGGVGIAKSLDVGTDITAGTNINCGGSYKIDTTDVINSSKCFVGSGGVNTTNEIKIYKDGWGLRHLGAAGGSLASIELGSLVHTYGGAIGTYSNHALHFITNNAFRMQITNAGYVSIGVGVNPASPLEVGIYSSISTGTAFAQLQALNPPTSYSASGSGIYNNSIKASDAITAGQFVAVSDRRIKQDIESIPPEHCIDFINNIRPVKYRLRTENNELYREFGYIAQELCGYPCLVHMTAQEGLEAEMTGDPENVLLSVNYEKVVPLLHGALRQTIAKNEELQSTVIDLQSQLDSLKNIVIALQQQINQ